MRERLVEITREIVAHGKAGTIPQTSEIYRVPVSHYTDEARWKLEMDRVFRRMPLMLALSVELRETRRLSAIDRGRRAGAVVARQTTAACAPSSTCAAIAARRS